MHLINKLYLPILCITLFALSLLFCACSKSDSISPTATQLSQPTTTASPSSYPSPSTTSTPIPSSSFPESSYFSIIEYGNGVIAIEDTYQDRFYLVQGSKRALLIDTGIGNGNLKEYIDKICPLPYDVVLTHGDYDHSGGCYAFQRVFIHYDDLPLLPDDSFTKERGTDSKKPVINGVTFEPLTDGQIFDLGDRTLEVLTTPGHTPGSIVLLDKKNKMLFLGDTANNQTLLQFDYCPPVEVYRESLLKLKAREKDYETLYICHPNYVIPKDCVDNLISICDEILAGTLTPYPHEFQGMSCIVAKKYKPGSCDREDGKAGNLVYNPNNIYKDKVKH